MSNDRCDLLCLDLERAEALRKRRPGASALDAAAGAARALGDPTRLAIAAILVEAEELCVCDLSWVVERAENLVSHHLRQLRVASLVASRREGKMVMYSLTERGRDLLRSTLAEHVVT